MRLFVGIDAPHHWARVNRQGQVHRDGVAENLESIPVKPRSDEVWAVVGGEDLVTAEVTIPTRHRRKLIQALPFALEDQLTEDVDAFHFSLIDWKPGHSAVAGIVSRERVRRLREKFAEAGIRLDGMVADYQLLPIHPQAVVTVADQGDGRVSLLRANGVGGTLDLESIELWWSSMEDSPGGIAVNDAALGRRLLGQRAADVYEWDIGNSFVQWLGHRSRNATTVNLLPCDESERLGEAIVPGLRPAVFLLCLAAIARIGVDAYEYVQLEREHQRLTREITEVFQQAFPEETRIVNARSQFRQKLAELSRGSNGGGEFQRLLVAVVPAMRSKDTSLEEVSFRDETLEIVCAVRNFADLDRLKTQFSRSGLEVELVGSGALDDRVTGRYRLKAGASG